MHMSRRCRQSIRRWCGFSRAVLVAGRVCCTSCYTSPATAMNVRTAGQRLVSFAAAVAAAGSSKRALSISSSCGLPAGTLKGNKKPLLLIASVCFLDPPNELPYHERSKGGEAERRARAKTQF